MNTWLTKHKKGTFNFTGLVDRSDAMVVTPQATVDYGYNWFSISDAPAIVKTPKYDKFFSVSIFDMKHNIPDVIVNPPPKKNLSLLSVRDKKFLKVIFILLNLKLIKD